MKEVSYLICENVMREHLALTICLQLMSDYEDLTESLGEPRQLTSRTADEIPPLNSPFPSLNVMHDNVLAQFKAHYSHVKEFNYGS